MATTSTALTAQELFGEVNRDTRGRAKTINFAILYGISRWGLAGRLAITADEAQAMIDRYFERFPGINNYIAHTIAMVRETQFTTTLFGRKTWFTNINSKIQHERQGAERAAINAPIQGTSADIIKRAMSRMPGALRDAGLHDVRMLLQVHDELVFELPESAVEAATPVIREVMATARGAVGGAWMCRWGSRSARAKPGAARISGEPLPVADDDIAQLARGGRTSFFGFVLRLAARLPFLFIAGRWYGADALGRFAYAVIVVEFAAQLATFGLKRGLAQQLSTSERDPVCDIWDALLVGFVGAAVAAAILIAFPVAMFPNSEVNGMDRLLPLTVFGWVGSDIALAALAYRGNVGATVRARAVWEPWVISGAAFALAWYSLRDGLIIAYVLSMAAALVASIVPLLREYGSPRGWRPQYARAAELARSNWPLAGADACEWGSRRLDIAILGLMFSPALVGIYYVAQQVASLPQKLKTTFDPILGPVITQKLAEDDKAAVARQVRQVGFLDHRRTARCRAGAGYPRRGGDGPGRTRLSSAVPRRWPSCSPPRPWRRRPW